MAEPVVRAATDEDMPAVREVASHFDLLGKWPGAPDYLDAERAFGALLVGEVAGRIVGFGGTLRRGAVTHLGDLFVLPDHQSSGVGRMLLSGLLPEEAPRITFASSDPRAMGLYVRNGMRPGCPLLYLAGSPQGGVESAGPPSLHDAGEVDTRVSGGDRIKSLAWYAGLPGVALSTTGGGYAFTRAVGGDLVVGPAGGDTPQDCVDAVLGAIAARPGAERVRVAMAGVHPLVPLLLGAGWRITDMDTFMTSDDGLVRLDRYVPHTDLG